MRFSVLLALSVSVSVACVACLPDDTRPPPGALTVVVTSSNSEPIATADGWQIQLERVLVSLGEVEPKESDDCSVYNEADYLRLLDGLRPEPQLLSRPYVLGKCELTFQLAPPNLDSVLGSGITTDDLVLLGTPGSDDYVQSSALSLYVAGTATSATTTKQFAWSFRNGVQYDPCTATGGGALVTLGENDSQTLAIELVVSSLFQDTPEVTSPLSFADFALADDAHGDADGTIDLDELANTPLTEPESSFVSLADRLYLGRVVLLPRPAGGTCSRGPIEDNGGP